MLADKLQEALNDQLNFEIYSSYIYLSMSSYFESVNLPGASHWMQIQAREEMLHAMKFFAYINDRDGRVILKEIPQPKSEWDSSIAVFENALEHERLVTSRICNLVDIAQTERDHVTNSMLQWFVTEQIEEEKNAKAIIDKLRMAGDNINALFMIDAELAQRVDTTATAAAAQ